MILEDGSDVRTGTGELVCAVLQKSLPRASTEKVVIGMEKGD